MTRNGAFILHIVPLPELHIQCPVLLSMQSASRPCRAGQRCGQRRRRRWTTSCSASPAWRPWPVWSERPHMRVRFLHPKLLLHLMQQCQRSAEPPA